MSCHDPTCQMLTASSRPQVTSTFPFASKVRSDVACPRSFSTFLHVPASQMSVVRSELDVTNHLPSGLNEKVLTRAACPANSVTFRHEPTSQTRAVLSPSVVTSHRPSGLKPTL